MTGPTSQQPAARPPLRGRPARGFTLIELLVAMVIVGVLTAIALPSYTRYVVRGKRSAAQAQMMDIANREEQFMLANRSYADKATLVANGYGLPSDVAANYSFDVTADSTAAPVYTITFSALGAQAGDGDLSLTSTGIKSPAAKW